ncbi:MAG: hypothetical protein AB7F59_09400 [Bdellovibrionales bacterium]
MIRISTLMLAATSYFIGAVLFCGAVIMSLAEITLQLDEMGAVTWNNYLTSFMALGMMSLVALATGYGITLSRTGIGTSYTEDVNPKLSTDRLSQRTHENELRDEFIQNMSKQPRAI